MPTFSRRMVSLRGNGPKWLMLSALGCMLFGIASMFSCSLDLRYQRCDPLDRCENDQFGRLLVCACDFSCRAECSSQVKCQEDERCVKGFCVHKNEKVNERDFCVKKGRKPGCEEEEDKANCPPKECEIEGQQRACSNKCGRGKQTCRGGVWRDCDAFLARKCTNPKGGCPGVQICMLGSWKKCYFGGETSP